MARPKRHRPCGHRTEARHRDRARHDFHSSRGDRLRGRKVCPARPRLDQRHFPQRRCHWFQGSARASRWRQDPLRRLQRHHHHHHCSHLAIAPHAPRAKRSDFQARILDEMTSLMRSRRKVEFSRTERIRQLTPFVQPNGPQSFDPSLSRSHVRTRRTPRSWGLSRRATSTLETTS